MVSADISRLQDAVNIAHTAEPAILVNVHIGHACRALRAMDAQAGILQAAADPDWA